jgi:hypothetical protein
MGLIAMGVVGAVGMFASSKIAADASHSAASMQQQSATQAIGLQTAIYNQQQQNLQPYRQLGGVGIAGLTNMAGQNPTMDPGGSGFVSQRNPQMGPAGSPTASSAGAGGGYYNYGASAPISAPGTAGPVPYQPPPGQGSNPAGGMVRVQAPTGEIALLSPDQAKQAEAKGATILPALPTLRSAIGMAA